MTMFKDFIKLNKLSSFFIGLLLALFYGGQLLFLLLIKVNLINELFNMNAITAMIPVIYVFSTMVTLVLLSATLFVSVVKTFAGNTREFILMHRGRSYYLKFQFLLISISGLLISCSFFTFRIIYQTFGYIDMFKATEFPPFKAVSFVIDPYFLIAIIVGTIALYYVVAYIIDIFSNSKYRYQRMLARNVAVLKFIIRVVLIAVLTINLFISAENFKIAYDNVYRNLLPSIGIRYIPGELLLLLIFITLVLIIDYIIYFKKKVLV